MIDIDVRRAMGDADHPGLRIAGRFVGLDKYAELLSRYLPHVKDQERLRFMAQLRRRGVREHLDKDELEEIEWITKELVPQHFIGAYAVALWAAVEQSSADLAEYVRGREALRLKFSDLRQANAWGKLLLFLETAWKKPIRFSKETTDRFDYLHAVRNSIAHASGSVAADKDTERRKKIQQLLKANIGVAQRNDHIILTHRFVRASTATVEAALKSVLNQVDDHYPMQ